MDRHVIYKGEHRIITPEDIDRFNDSYEVVESGCWIWTGVGAGDGYGSTHYGGIQWRAHVLSHLIHNATEITVDKPNVLHSCHVPLCVFYGHLRAGTQQDNIDDMMEAGRHVTSCGEKNGMYGVDRSGEKNPMYGRTGEECPMYGVRGPDHPSFGLTGEKSPNYIPGPISEEKKPKGYKLAEVDARLIHKLKADGHGPAYITRATGLPYAGVSAVCQGKTWTHILC